MPLLSGRPLPLVLAVVLLLLIGLSGLLAGLTIIQTMAGAAPLPTAGVAIGVGIAAYGVVATAAGLGLLRRRGVAWRAGVLVLGAGLLVQVALLAVSRLDAVSAVGLAIWGLALACLAVPATRRAIGV
jgi:hypothetical protein